MLTVADVVKLCRLGQLPAFFIVDPDVKFRDDDGEVSDYLPFGKDPPRAIACATTKASCRCRRILPRSTLFFADESLGHELFWVRVDVGVEMKHAGWHVDNATLFQGVGMHFTI